MTNPTSQDEQVRPPTAASSCMDSPEDIQRKFKRAITDSDTENCVRYDPGAEARRCQPYDHLLRRHRQELRGDRGGIPGPGLRRLQARCGRCRRWRLCGPSGRRPSGSSPTRPISSRSTRQGAQKASAVARKTLRKVYKRIGFVEKPSPKPEPLWLQFSSKGQEKIR